MWQIWFTFECLIVLGMVEKRFGLEKENICVENCTCWSFTAFWLLCYTRLKQTESHIYMNSLTQEHTKHTHHIHTYINLLRLYYQCEKGIFSWGTQTRNGILELKIFHIKWKCMLLMKFQCNRMMWMLAQSTKQHQTRHSKYLWSRFLNISYLHWLWRIHHLQAA